jgi:PhnB protein
MLAVRAGADAIRFYIEAFEAQEVGERYPWQGKIGHTEMKIGDARIMLADEFPEHNVSPKTLGGSPVILHLRVHDVDRVTARCVAAGASLERAPEDQPYGRMSRIRDPFGHIWMLNGPITGS